eukprot:CAMPEP_0198310832 /NCGR_PEP_ID=MMETSP1450-20131203/2749_1 /TAXON_ID=753684 ORGANISM="Madagascaria erythrocladiodes, Strain CCMP3234" /NCGR_SAMPLE_ID=MMETSP1450 /ASSEMBLY_ACC=CAM_ASM_001115 /LENGTH=411 /DNA_ID=CAMNT_0044013681 /DNA_START=199 /DNA_END=1434 /DNA_ORIENTATION=-
MAMSKSMTTVRVLAVVSTVVLVALLLLSRAYPTPLSPAAAVSPNTAALGQQPPPAADSDDEDDEEEPWAGGDEEEAALAAEEEMEEATDGMSTQIEQRAPDTTGKCEWRKYAGLTAGDDAAEEVRKILYVKVPKTGSSTVSTLLHYFAQRRGLSVPNVMFISNEGTLRTAMQEEKLQQVDILASHLRYNDSMAAQFLGESPFRLATVRAPAARYLSAFWHARQKDLQGRRMSFVCTDMAKNYTQWAAKCGFVQQWAYMAPVEWGNEKRRDVDVIFNHYNHILVTERMTESILALAPKLKLSLRDMLLLNEKTGKKGSAMRTLTDEEIADLTQKVDQRVARDPSAARDLRLYNKANVRLDEELAALPEDLRGMKDDLDAMIAQLNDVCTADDFRSFSQGECIDTWVKEHVEC